MPHSKQGLVSLVVAYLRSSELHLSSAIKTACKWNDFRKNKPQKNPLQSATWCPVTMTTSAVQSPVKPDPWAHQTFLPCTMQNCKRALYKHISPKLKHLFRIGDGVDSSTSNICYTAHEKIKSPWWLMKGFSICLTLDCFWLKSLLERQM